MPPSTVAASLVDGVTPRESCGFIQVEPGATPRVCEAPEMGSLPVQRLDTVLHIAGRRTDEIRAIHASAPR
jgi:hypothetical protein